ncbi:MAG: succinylglutamate desuccinylase/aspartoacylase family protein [Verrucomicrobiae bacterium]|nr:succinylglutamate desuccinylase/aspartoacylase family protein [Verrucomicrobiae bacterium]
MHPSTECSRAPRPFSPKVGALLGPLEELARRGGDFYASHLDLGEAGPLARYIYLGPAGGGDVQRIGVFAGIHGDEREGAISLPHFIRALTAKPDAARGYELYFYPVCNPTGVEDGTRLSRSGKDLNREFWAESAEPEVRALEGEIESLGFQGIIALHADDTSNGIYGFVSGASLTQDVLEPALRSAEAAIPRNRSEIIDSFPAENGVILEGYPGVLRGPPDVTPRPFEIVFETPQRADLNRQIEANVLALTAILTRYSELLAFSANL